MESPLSPLLAAVFMTNLEDAPILNNNLSKKHIIFWFRYLDDILVAFYFRRRQSTEIVLTCDWLNAWAIDPLEKPEMRARPGSLWYK